MSEMMVQGKVAVFVLLSSHIYYLGLEHSIYIWGTYIL